MRSAPPAQWPLVAIDAALTVWWARRREEPPTWSLVVAGVATAGLLALRPEIGAVLVLVLLTTGMAILRLPDRPAVILGAVSLGLMLLAGLRQRLQLGSDQGLISDVVGYSVAFGALISSRQRVRHQWETERLLAELAEEHRRLEEAHARLAAHARQVAELAASEERNRIAREIHDVLAHSLTAIIVQAEAATVRLRGGPEAAAEPVRTVAGLARAALQEARLSVAAIRADPGAAGAEALRRLCDDATRLGGIRCDLTTEGEEQALPAPVAHACYRILQEALTNARRHGQARSAEVCLMFADGRLTLTITDDGSGAASTSPLPGSGLQGMRERALGVGGSVSAGPVAGGGFRVHAEFPLADAGAGGEAP